MHHADNSRNLATTDFASVTVDSLYEDQDLGVTFDEKLDFSVAEKN